MTKNLVRARCPHCDEWHTYRNGYNIRAGGEKVRRWYCRDCGQTFQESNVAKPPPFQFTRF